MAIEINQNDGFVTIAATAGQVNLDFDFPLFEKSHLTIIRTRSSVEETLTLNTDYTIADDQLEVEAGGTAVLDVAALAGDVYTLLLNVPEERTTDFNEAGDFLANTLNRELDLMTQIEQQLRRDVNKAATLPATSTLETINLPTPEALKLIGWNSSADSMVNYAATDLSGSVVTSFAETLLDDATAAEARTTLDVPSTSEALLKTGGTMTGDITMSGADVNFAATVSVATTGGNTWDIGTAASNNVEVTAGGSITSLGVGRVGVIKFVNVASAAGLVHNATSLKTPTGSDIITASGDKFIARCIEDNTAKWEILSYTRASGYPLTVSSVTYQATPADPTGTTETTGVMMGLAGSITPAKTGKIEFTVVGNMANSVAGSNQCKARIRYGTGTAPANGAALTGTEIGQEITTHSSNNDFKAAFALNSIVSSLSIGTTYWFDISLAAIVGGTASASNLNITAKEI